MVPDAGNRMLDAGIFGAEHHRPVLVSAISDIVVVIVGADLMPGWYWVMPVLSTLHKL